MAHTTSELTQNLDAKKLTAYKSNWETQVRDADSEAIRQASCLHHDAWWYFNHRRIFELATALELPLELLSIAAQQHGVAHSDGSLVDRTNDAMNMYRGGDGMHVFAYVREILHHILDHASVRNISNHLDRSILGNVLRPGDLIFVQGRHAFTAQSETRMGPGQPYTGRRRANGVSVEYAFDHWESTSVSSQVHLSGYRRAASIARVVDLKREDGRLTVYCSVLAIGAAFSGLKGRFYENFQNFEGDEDNDDDKNEL